MALSRFVCSLLMLVLISSALQFPSASAQESSAGSTWRIEVTFEIRGTDADPYFFQTITAVVAPDASIPGMFTGNGTGTWQWRDPPTAECPPYSGTGDFPAMVSGLIGEVQTAEGKEYSVGLQAVPGRSLAESEDFEKHYSVTCHSPPDYVFDEERSSAPVPLLPQITLKSNASSWYGEEILYQTDCCVSKFTATLSPPEVKYRIFGTINNAKGKPMPESKVVVGDYDTISGGAGPLQMLSQSTPDFEKETIAAETDAHYEFELERSATDPLRAAVVSLLWYDGEGQFAVTSGQQVGGRYIPIYQAACADHNDSDCIKWERTADGFEAQVDFSYGFDSSDRHSKVMAQEPWNTGGRDIGIMIRDASVIYTNSYKAMKYFESVKGTVGNPLNPVRIDIYNSIDSSCIDEATGRQRDNAFFVSVSREPFGGLGTFLEAQDAIGGTATICTETSSEAQPDAPINREYHELGHYLQSDMYYSSSIYGPNRGSNHGGYANDGTNDSLTEGFASFVAMLVAEHYNEIESGEPKYPLGTHSKNLEHDYRVWGDNVRMFRLDDGRIVSYFSLDRRNEEEWAVAGLLWDLHDSGREFHVAHMTSAANDPTELWAPISEVYNVTRDNVALFDHHILDNIRSAKPMNLVDLYAAFSGDVSRQDLDMIFISHGAFGDILKRDLVHGVGESVGPTGSTEAPVRPARSSPQPNLNGSYISSEGDAIFEVMFTHREPYSFYDYSYNLNMTKGVPAYFEMPPSYYPSIAQFFQVSPDGKISDDSSLNINSTEYWNYIYSDPEENAIFKTIEIAQGQQPVIPASQDDEATGSVPSQPSGCLIATAAYGSELAPQVQFLRDFRDQRIMATAAGSSFMNVFNSWYYSFSPHVADYERQQPWLQQGVRIAIQPLLAILTISEKAYAGLPGEYGAVIAGLTASSLIGGVYLWPLALLPIRSSKLSSRTSLKILAAVILGSVVAIIVAIAIGNTTALMTATSALVVSTIAASSLMVAILARFVLMRFKVFRDRYSG